MGSSRTERLKPLHNFNLPSGLSWGNQRQLRCMKIEDNNRSNNDDIAAVRQMVMLDLHNAASKFISRPSNLRTRRAAVAASASAAAVSPTTGKNNNLDFDKTNYSEEKSSPMRVSGEKREREKFSVSLSRKEIDEDFSGMGVRLPRRPKKRPRSVQKQMDTLFPGLWLTEVTADMYKVTEQAP